LKKSMREAISDALDLPKDTLLDLPKIILTGNKEVFIENYKGIVEYTDEVIRLNTSTHMLRITGKNLGIREIGDDEITLFGDVLSVEFI
jgi:sporulation protein YqfC